MTHCFKVISLSRQPIIAGFLFYYDKFDPETLLYLLLECRGYQEIIMFKKRNFFSKLRLKHTDRTRYKLYKWELQNYELEQISNFYTGKNVLDTVGKIVAESRKERQLNVLHSGNAGDIIYALPTLKKIYGITGVPINLYLRLNQPLILSGYLSHPMGNVMLNEKMASMLSPLIGAQDYISSCLVYDNQKIHIDLDVVRSKTIPVTNGNIARWYSYFTGITPELWKSWLTVQPDSKYANSIILARSGRYLNPSIDYSFLRRYDNIVFIGVKSEYDAMKKVVPNMEWVQVTDFYQLAGIIQGAKFFIGNQSLPYAIAEGLKAPRILEVYSKMANVIPEGENGYEFYFQNHFEELVHDLSSVKGDPKTA